MIQHNKNCLLSILLITSCLNPNADDASSSSSSDSHSTFSTSTTSLSEFEEIQTLTSSSISETSTSEVFTSFNNSGETETNSTSTTTETTGNIELCGNGILDSDEECEELQYGNLCRNCKFPRYVFVTDENYNGSFGNNSSNSIEIADQYCQYLASEFNLQGEYKSWLSDNTLVSSPKFRLNSINFDGYYLLPDNSILAEGWESLNEDLIINIRASGEIIPHDYFVWTNTYFDGIQTGADDSNCNNWTSQENYGVAGHTSFGWSNFMTIKCSTFAAFYCFQTATEAN